jgi:hypothetical protein
MRTTVTSQERRMVNMLCMGIVTRLEAKPSTLCWLSHRRYGKPIYSIILLFHSCASAVVYHYTFPCLFFTPFHASFSDDISPFGGNNGRYERWYGAPRAICYRHNGDGKCFRLGCLSPEGDIRRFRVGAIAVSPLFSVFARLSRPRKS